MADGNDDTPAENEPGVEDFERWAREQRQFAGVYQRGMRPLALADDAIVVTLSVELAALLFDLHNDDVLWKMLEKNEADLERVSEEQRVQLQAVTNIEWADFLTEAGYRPPPPAKKLSNELRYDIERAINNPGANLRDLRDRVLELAVVLDPARVGDRPAAFHRMATRFLLALPAAARAAAVTGVGAAASVGTAAVATPTLGGLGPAMGKVVGAATVKALDRALPRGLGAQRLPIGYLRELVGRELSPDAIHRHMNDANVLFDLTSDHPSMDVRSAAYQSGNLHLFGSVLAWIDHCIAVVFAVLDGLERADRVEVEARLEKAADRLIRVRAALADQQVGATPIEQILLYLRADLEAIHEALAWDP